MIVRAGLRRSSSMRRLTGLLALVALIGLAPPSLAASDVRVNDGLAPHGDRLRKSTEDLSGAERHALVSALLSLKHTASPYPQDRARGWSWYDTFVHWHDMLADCEATDLNLHPRMQGHAGPMFLPWHREYLLLLENALRSVSHEPITLPYWDWTNHASVGSLFTDDFMGPSGNPADGYAVDTGPFNRTSWPLVIQNAHGAVLTATSATSYLVRDLGDPSTLPTMDDVKAAFAASAYDVAPYDDSADPARSFRQALEGFPRGGGPSLTGCLPDQLGTTGGTQAAVPLVRGATLHNAVHTWVGGTGIVTPRGVLLGGTMTVTDASPNDPIFFLHHANIDRLWAEWQAAHPDRGYAPSDGSYPKNGLHDPMYPFSEYGINVTPADVISSESSGYRYTRPRADVLGTGGGWAAGERASDAAAGSSWWCRS